MSTRAATAIVVLLAAPAGGCSAAPAAEALCPSTPFVCRGHEDAANTAARESPPIETRIIPIPAGASGEQIAASFCAQIASGRGSASVTGQFVVAQDFAPRLDLLEQMAQAVARRPPGGAPSEPR